MGMTEAEIVDFLNKHLDLLKDNNFEGIDEYNFAADSAIYWFIYKTLGINFLKYMSYIPVNCFIHTPLDKIDILKNIKTIKFQAFLGCKKLESIIIPETVEKIESRVFMGCENLKSVVILNKDIEIGSQAFIRCKGLEEMTLPASFNNRNAINTILGLLPSEPVPNIKFNWI